MRRRLFPPFLLHFPPFPRKNIKISFPLLVTLAARLPASSFPPFFLALYLMSLSLTFFLGRRVPGFIKGK